MSDEREAKGFSKSFLKNHDKSVDEYNLLMQSFSSDEILKATDYPDNYGGAYIDRQGVLVIFTSENVDEAKKDFAVKTKNENITIKTCKYSFRKLTETMDTLNTFVLDNLDNDITKNITSFALIDSENKIVVELIDFSQEKIDEFKKNVSSDSCIEFIQSEGECVADVNVNPGAGITATGGGGSVGYRVKRNCLDGILTSGHVATSTSSATNWIRMSKNRKAYPIDISRESFELIREDLEAATKKTRPRTYDLYDIFCAVLYLLKEGCTWRAIPHDYPNWSNVRHHFDIWAGATRF
jgi:hypothetical protein